MFKLFKLNRKSLYFVTPMLFIVMKDRGHQTFVTENQYTSFCISEVKGNMSYKIFDKVRCIFPLEYLVTIGQLNTTSLLFRQDCKQKQQKSKNSRISTSKKSLVCFLCPSLQRTASRNSGLQQSLYLIIWSSLPSPHSLCQVQ